MTLANSQLSALFVTALVAIAFPARADVDMYVEHGGGRIHLAGRCTKDRINWCTCAVADETASPSVDQATMCWVIEGGRIIFSNFTDGGLRIEKRLEDMKTEITAPASLVPASGPVEGTG